jgi:hypothetical protein
MIASSCSALGQHERGGAPVERVRPALDEPGRLQAVGDAGDVRWIS